MGYIGISLHCRKIFFLAFTMFINIRVEFNNMGKKHSIRSSMWNMKHSSQLVCHTVSNSKSCCIKRQSGQTGCYMHFFTGMHVTAIQIGTQQEYSTDFNCFLCKSRRKLIMRCTDIGFQRMGKYIHTCISCDSRRYTFHKLSIQDRLICSQTVSNQRIFHMCLCIVYYSKRCNLRSGTAGSRNGNQTYFSIIIDLQGKLTDCFGRINGRTASNCNNCLRLILKELLYAFCNLIQRCIRHHITKNIIFNSCTA